MSVLPEIPSDVNGNYARSYAFGVIEQRLKNDAVALAIVAEALVAGIDYAREYQIIEDAARDRAARIIEGAIAARRAARLDDDADAFDRAFVR